MTSEVFARVCELFNKGTVRSDKGQLLSAAEYFGSGAEEARAFGEDNLVAIHMQLEQAYQLGNYGTSRYAVGTATASFLAAHRAQFIALLCDSIEALERRRSADTLLEGKCSPIEEDWCTFVGNDNAEAEAEVEAARFAPLVGHQFFMIAASHAVKTLSLAREFAAECSEAQFGLFVRHVVRAADLMQHSSATAGGLLGVEAAFVYILRKFVDDPVDSGLNPRLAKLLVDTLQRLERSIMHYTHYLENITKTAENEASKSSEAVRASLTAQGLRSCSLAGCGAKEAHPQHFKRCAACRTVAYCSREHQVADWPAHKAACKAARRAQAPQDAAEQD